MEVDTLFLQGELAAIPIYASAGFALKLSDYYGERGEAIRGYLASLLAAFLFWLMLNVSGFSSALTLAIIFGSILTAKTDRGNLLIGLILLAALAGALGFVNPHIIPLIPMLILAVFDEVIHGWAERLRGLASYLARYRFSLKLGVIGLAFLSLMPVSYTHLTLPTN